ncbi:MAG: Membrane protein involved in colicin uptake-like protein [Chthoniobacteraceae bacterium]|nr:Membrane protein involved in colicin uptake-like protein [Chthoniobacteraceae bacterium]
MKTPRLLTLLLVFAAVFAGLAPRSTVQADTSFSFFYDSLDPLGDWIQTDAYGYCWRPDGVDADWAPYTDGYWAYTDAGWTWVSYEDWGSICYHYGRWVNLDEEGWCWVPDYQWAPAWVSWRNSDDYVGWAPLPPEAHFTEDVGISVWADSTYDIGPSHYNFCAVRDFGAPVLRQVIIPRFRNVTFIQSTVNITNISFNRGNRFVCNGGPQYGFISGRSTRPVPTLKLVQNTNINIVNNNTTIINRNTNRPLRGLQHAVQRGNTLEVFAPSITAPANPLLVKPERVKRVVGNRGVNKGWAGVKDPAEREALRGKLREQTAGLTPQTTHAKAMPVADMKVVPEKADPTAPSPFSNPRGRGGKRNQDETPGTAQVPGTGRDGAPIAPSNGSVNNGKRGDNKRGDRNDPPAVAAPGQDSLVADDQPVTGRNGKPQGGFSNSKNGKRGDNRNDGDNRNNPPAVAAPDAPVAVEQTEEKGRKGRGNADADGSQKPGRGERVASPVATAERERMLEQQGEKKREKAEAADARQQQAETAKEAARQRHEEQVQGRQAAVARQQAEREAGRERDQQAATERKLQQTEQQQQRRQGGFERAPQDRPEVQKPQQQQRGQNEAAARAADAREQQQRQNAQERAGQQQQQRQAQMERQQQQQQQRQIERPQQRVEPQRGQQEQMQQRAQQQQRAEQQQHAQQQQQQQQRPQVQQQQRPQQEAPGRGHGRQLTPEEAAAQQQKKNR